MKSYMRQIHNAKTCDVITVKTITLKGGNQDPTLGAKTERPAAPQYYSLHVNTGDLPNLQEYRGSASTVSIKRFQQFKIDKVTYKFKVVNARAIYMDPNFREPDGSGKVTTLTGAFTDVKNHQKYMNNTFAVHKRLETDVQGDIEITDWNDVFNSRFGSIEWIKLNRPKGKMIQMGAFTDRRMTFSDDGTVRNTIKHGVPLGWLDNSVGEVKIGEIGVIVPGLEQMGWDFVTSNILPIIEVEARVCCSLRANAFSLDDN